MTDRRRFRRKGDLQDTVVLELPVPAAMIPWLEHFAAWFGPTVEKTAIFLLTSRLSDMQGVQWKGGSYGGREAAQAIRGAVATFLQAPPPVTQLERAKAHRLMATGICSQSDHAFARDADGRCARCKGAAPPEGPFVGTITDLKGDISREWTGRCEKGAKCAGTRLLEAFRKPDDRWALRPGVFGSIVSPDGRRWQLGVNDYGRDDWVPA